ncbi:GGDEF domain-containing protein [Clostridium beijerinckii]|uniref:GGDEF domain-containing protein n=1 Tax=Clostridium beijerinckii TaxID=1520 RepID=UPI00156FEE13|nr:GGDEF domain-containing protein [Clostridium beijerinckii]NRT73168.1 diguanylate cyclase (GGDEF)-like protein [Clostridium beijerinckii]
MGSIFIKEEKILENSVSILESSVIETEKDRELYGTLVGEYKELLEQMKRMVKVSDIMENKLNLVRHSIDEISKFDFLTNVYNRRYFDMVLTEEWKKSKEANNCLAILMIDIDKFKEYNDKYGHVEGDKCLQNISMIIKNVVNQSNSVVSRYGGEEFIALISNSDLEKAKCIAENIRKDIEKLGILHEASEHRSVTVSIGVAVAIPNMQMQPEDLIVMADQALYRAKGSGRNRMEV